MNYNKKSLELHKKKKGKVAIVSKMPVRNKTDLSLAYTPGVAEPSKHIAKSKHKVYDYTFKGNAVAVITDGSAVLGLGNIGPEAALPVMEGKAILFKEFAGIDSVPICLDTQDTEEIIKTVRYIAPTFGGINLEDIAAPRCFEIEARLQNLGIPVFHDDQHGTAVVVTAGLINALKVTHKSFKNITVVINGAGAAGTAIMKMLSSKNSPFRVKNIIVCDSKGIVYSGRRGNTKEKKEIAQASNKNKLRGTITDALIGADVFVGVSKPNILHDKHIKSMNSKPIIFALSNPVPEIMPDVAIKAGAAVIATGRSDFPNQVNNVLAFPGIFRGALDAKAKRITEDMKQGAAIALAKVIKKPMANKILPNPFDKKIALAVAGAVAKSWKKKKS